MARDVSPLTEDDLFINARQLRRILPFSDMTIRRWEDDPAIGFPRHVKFNNGHRSWNLVQIRKWVKEKAKGRAATADTSALEELSEVAK